jgi:hypothetical protein
MPRRRSTHVRCRDCRSILPGWLPIPNVPDSALLLHHLRAMHPVAVKLLLTRMET